MSRVSKNQKILIPTGILLGEDSICNLDNERSILLEAIKNSEHLVIYGRRNTGKTSLVTGVGIQAFKKLNKKSIVIFADLLGVLSIDDLEGRFKRGLEKGLSESFPTKTFAKNVVAGLKNLQPKIGLDPNTGKLEFQLEVKSSSGKTTLEQLILEINALSQKIPVLIVLDEFQDLYFVKSGVATLRSALQNLKSNLPIIILGSKKHLLSKIFAIHRAPMAGWGRDLEIPVVETPEYLKSYKTFVNNYFEQCKSNIGTEELKFLVEQMQGVPESINIVCNYLIRTSNEKIFSKNDILNAVINVAEERRGRYEEMFARLKSNERSVLTAIAKNSPVNQIKSKDFLSKVGNVAPTSVLHAARKLEDHAEIYKTEQGFVVAEPLLGVYLREFK